MPTQGQIQSHRDPRWRRGLLLFLIICGYWFVGFYPLNPLPVHTNDAYINDHSALSLGHRGIAYTEFAPQWLTTAIETGELELTFELLPKDTVQKHATIFTIGNDQKSRNLVLSQYEQSLIIQRRKNSDPKAKLKSHYIGRAFKDDATTNIKLVLKADEIDVYVNGKQRIHTPTDDDSFKNWARDQRVALGNIPEFGQPWRGEIRQAQVRAGDKTVDYLSPGTLSIPATYQFIRERSWNAFLDTNIYPLNKATIRDFIINFFGFIPLGFIIVAMSRSHHKITRAVFVCFFVTASIEGIQVLLPYRVPSIYDVTLNVAGGLVGAWLAAIWVYLRYRNEKSKQFLYPVRNA